MKRLTPLSTAALAHRLSTRLATDVAKVTKPARAARLLLTCWVTRSMTAATALALSA
ncbi:Uncharacterised protein [Burkholderia pseudomallei]|nr:Uncharacterised protein [Burkholderia pseudomallei]CPJ22702.1 Uncharacterised protein [Burkholderia pseudomallei]